MSDASSESDAGSFADLEIGARIGTGVYGIVYRARWNDMDIALKRNVGTTRVNGICTLKELDALERLKGHPLVVGYIRPLFTNRGTFGEPASPFTDAVGKNFYKSDGDDKVHFIMNLEKTNLAEAAKRGIAYSSLKRIVTQMFLGVEWMSLNGVCHRDLKTNNILYNRDPKDPVIKICDFGLATHSPHSGAFFTTPGLVTSWYRAPEVCVGAEYTDKIDVWSLATILFEIVCKKALLRGTDDNDAEIVAAVLSRVPGIVSASDAEEFFSSARGIDRETVSSVRKLIAEKNITIPKTTTRAVAASAFRSATKLSAKEAQDFEEGVGATLLTYCDLIAAAATFVPDKRPSATELLNSHAFFGDADTQRYISKIRRSIPIDTTDFDPDVSVRPGEFRSVVFQVLVCLWNNSEQIDWYDDRVIFHTADALDRYAARRESPDLSDGETKESVYLRVYTVAYMFHKFFVSLGDVCKWERFAPEGYTDDQKLIDADDFEEFMVKDICGLKIFRKTVLEAMIEIDGRVRKSHVRAALMAMREAPEFDGKLSEFFAAHVAPALG